MTLSPYSLSLKSWRVGLRTNQNPNFMEITVQTIKDCRKAVNQAKFRPTKGRKALAVKLLTELAEAVSNLEEVKPKPKAKKKSKTSKRKPKNQRLEESQAKQNTAENFISDEVAEVNTLPEFSELRSMGYSVEDAVRYCKALMQGAPQTA
tara:strand:- start:58 stop:507 length:450 start_codon:yes stop_codon:yes gene_type:complete